MTPKKGKLRTESFLSFYLSVVVQRDYAALTSEAGFLVSTKWHFRRHEVEAVDIARARLKLGDHSVCATQVTEMFRGFFDQICLQ